MTNFNNNLVFDANEHNKAIEYMKDYSESYKKEYGNAPKAFVHSYGCQQNVADGEVLQGLLNKMGYQLTDDEGIADFILYNTCAIRENAENTVFGNVGELKHLKEIKPEIIVGVCGCMTQQKHILDKISESYPFVDMIFGAGAMDTLPQLLAEKMKEKGKVFYIGNPTRDIVEGLPLARENNHQAYVSIMWGCDNFCTYCVVPYVRGRERSREPEQIIAEVKGLIAQGYKEITLLGQNVNSYKGNGYKEIYTFADLLRAVNDIDGIEIINFISPHPKDFTDDVIDAIRDCKKINRILHLPLQSGSSNVLKLMNRKYTKEGYINLAKKIKHEVPDVVFSTDIIVGFPGETEEDFKDTLDEKVKHERFERLKQLVEKQLEENNKKYIGTEQEILIEGVSKNNKNTLTGRTKTNKIVILEADDSYIGKIINVKIVSEHMWYLKGEMV